MSLFPVHYFEGSREQEAGGQRGQGDKGDKGTRGTRGQGTKGTRGQGRTREKKYK
ncbi:hypothetical protein [Chroococcidiopsis cubana]|uniref:hypothetical protein n=1 Tax=Chroococcidiopsis cubana TaxID=171392 RepID=UPI002ACE62CA|nr:hypothetical protein [Chroococcidiopsis cubana]